MQVNLNWIMGCLQKIFWLILEILKLQKEQVTLTVPEGKWAKEVAEALAKKFPYKASEIEKSGMIWLILKSYQKIILS